jgi:hypothetical protein
MRRYSEAVKADVRKRMSPPHRQSVAWISEELGIHLATRCRFTRYDKSLDVLQEAIRNMPPTEREFVEFVLQWTRTYSLPCGSVIEPDLTLRERHCAEFIAGFEDSNENYEWISKIDIIELPYCRKFYHDRMSRVAVDAALAGIPTVYQMETWLEELYTKYGSGVSFVAVDSDSLARAILEVSSRHHLHTQIAFQRIGFTL